MQRFSGRDKLGEKNAAFGYGGKAVPAMSRSAGAIWAAAGSQINDSANVNTPLRVEFGMLITGLAPVAASSETEILQSRWP